MTDTLVEQMAAAMRPKMGGTATSHDLALAALRAIRVPTLKMREAADDVWVLCGDELADGFREAIWQAMIDAAIAEAEAKP